MKIFILIIVLVILTSIAPAAILKVASDGTQSYAQISDAIAASSSSDTILVMGGSYAGFTVDRKLVIIGSGTGIGSGEGALVTSRVTVTDAADSTELRSLWLRSAYSDASYDSVASVLWIHSGATRIFVWRCFVENSSGDYWTNCLWIGHEASADVVQCVLWCSGGAGSYTHAGLMQRANSTLNVISCVLANVDKGFSRYASCTGALLNVTHCLVTMNEAGGATTPYFAFTEAAGVVENSAYITTSPSYPPVYSSGNLSYSYCAYTQTAPPGATHIQTTTAAFSNMVVNNARASNYHLAVGSNLIDAGNPGSLGDLDMTPADIGIYGGQHPYVDGGVPDYPFAVQLAVPYSAPLNGTMRVAGRGRVGPGN